MRNQCEDGEGSGRGSAAIGRCKDILDYGNDYRLRIDGGDGCSEEEVGRKSISGVGLLVQSGADGALGVVPVVVVVVKGRLNGGEEHQANENERQVLTHN